MTKRHTTIRLSELADRQLDDLKAAWGCTGTETIAIALDRAHREETYVYTVTVGASNKHSQRMNFESAARYAARVILNHYADEINFHSRVTVWHGSLEAVEAVDGSDGFHARIADINAHAINSHQIQGEWRYIKNAMKNAIAEAQTR